MMGRTTLKDEYFSWLYTLIGDQRRTYKKLCKELNQKKFRWSIYNDDNRLEDGRKLRDTFIEEKNIDESHIEVRYFLKSEPTVFEVLVALAQRINDLMYDLNHQEDHTSKWFLEILTNLRISRFTDNFNPDKRFGPVTETEINEILEIWLDRTYDFHGSGGLFPLKRRPPRDQRDVEIWYQLMLYLDENYGM